MKDEIKEILDSLDFQVNHTNNWIEPLGLDQNTWKTLLDYITNLQESEAYYYGQYKDYKSRNEKAIELLKEAGCYEEDTKIFCGDIYQELPELLNILIGGDE